MPWLLLALLVVPIIEIYVLIQVGQSIGALPTVGLLVFVAVLGGWLIRREGARAWAAFTEAASSGRLPAREVADGALVMFGGALLLSPGFVTDIVGLLCVLPPTRAVLRRVLMRVITRRAAAGLGWSPATVRVQSYRDPSGRGPDAARRPAVIEGEVDDERNRPGS